MDSREDSFKNDRYIRTISGRKFHLFGNESSEIDIKDIAISLSNICRFTGHVTRAYSVAEHSLLVLKLVRILQGHDSAEILLSALLHDAPEAYLADVSSPFKGALVNYHALEERTWQRIADKHGLSRKMDPVIKEADRIALFMESLILQPHSKQETWPEWEKYGVRAEEFLMRFDIPRFKPAEAQRIFLLEVNFLRRGLLQENWDACQSQQTVSGGVLENGPIFIEYVNSLNRKIAMPENRPPQVSAQQERNPGSHTNSKNGTPLISTHHTIVRQTHGLPTNAAARKDIPVVTGFADYFPDAIAAVAELSRAGNEQHNPGTPLHWDRSKSGDEADALGRHLLQRGTIDADGQRHSAKVAWRAMALLQKEIEAELK